MNKKARNIAIGILVGALVTGGYVLHKSKSNSMLEVKGLKPSTTSIQPIPTPVLTEVVENEDGSINFKCDFPEEYNYDKNDNLPEVIGLGTEEPKQEPIPTPVLTEVVENEDGSINFKCDFPEKEKTLVKENKR